MSKRILFLCLVTMMMASNAFASRARQLVMGSADPFGIIPHGTFFYDDNLNSIYNPSFANDFKNWASVERSNSYTSPGTTAATNIGNIAAVQAEGGAVTNFSGINVGLYLNRGDAVLGTYTAGTAPIRPIDLTIAGDAGLKWGLGLTYASRALATNKSSFMQARLGAQVADFDPFFHFVIAGKDTVQTAGVAAATSNKNTDMTFGTRYHFGEWIPFFAVKMSKNTTTALVDSKTNAFGFGFGRNTKLTEGVHMNYALSYWKASSNSNTATASAETRLPIDMSVEADLAGWITGRAGLNYRLIDQTNGFSNTSAPTGRMGATIHAGKMDLDFAFGSGFAANSNGNVDFANLDIGSGTFVAASANYKW